MSHISGNLVLACLTYLTQYNVLRIHQFCHKQKDFHFFIVIFYYGVCLSGCVWGVYIYHIILSLKLFMGTQLVSVQQRQGCIYLFNILFLFPFATPEVELLEHMVVLLLIFLRPAIQFSIKAEPIYIPNNSVQEFPLFSQYLLSLLDDNHTNR